MAILSLLAGLVVEFVRSEPSDPLTWSTCNFSKQNPYITLQASELTNLSAEVQYRDKTPHSLL